MLFSNLNYLGILSATICYCGFSGIWHRQFAFGKIWEGAMGFNRPQNWKETNIYYIIPFFSCLATTTAIAILQNFANIASFQNALTLGVTMGVGFGLTLTFTNATIPIMKKPLVFGIITGSAHAIGITLASIIVYAI